MNREFKRSDRVASQMQRQLAVILQSEIKDPRLGLVTINEVRVSRDLAVATVYFTVLDADPQKVLEQQKILTQAASFLRRELGHRLRIRTVPELRFKVDDSLERGERLDRIFKEIDGEDSGAE